MMRWYAEYQQAVGYALLAIAAFICFLAGMNWLSGATHRVPGILIAAALILIVHGVLELIRGNPAALITLVVGFVMAVLLFLQLGDRERA